MTNQPAEPWTVLKLLNWTKDDFARLDVDEPRLSAEILLAHTLGCKRIELYTRFDYQPTPAQLEQYRQLIQRARNHEPVAYLVGTKEFFSLKFKVTPDVLIPRPETEMLVVQAVEHLRKLSRATLVWDVCTGSGCVAVAIASQVKDATVLATDISPAAVAVAAENAAANKVEAAVRCCVADLLTLPGGCEDMKDFDVITANPPYVVKGQPIGKSVSFEPGVALWAGDGGFELSGPIIERAGGLLGSGGMLAMEFGLGQADGIRDRIVATGEFHEPRIIRDHQTIERSVTAIRK